MSDNQACQARFGTLTASAEQCMCSPSGQHKDFSNQKCGCSAQPPALPLPCTLDLAPSDLLASKVETQTNSTILLTIK